jgi:glycosyltransferase involved in cell wall biosynthesis
VKHNNIVVINQTNKGVSIARNVGLAEAKGEYVYFMDPDDILIDNSLSILIAHLSGTQIDILMADYVRFNDGDMSEEVLHAVQDYSSVEKTAAEAFCEDLSPYECYIWRMLIRREFLLCQKIDFKPFWYEDTLFCQECYLKADRCVKASLKLYYYRLHSGSFTSSMNLKKMLNLNSALAALWNLRGVGNAQLPKVKQKLMDNIFRSFSYGIWCISHNEQLCANRKQIVSDLKSKIPPKEFYFAANPKQRLISVLYRYIPNLYIVIRSMM